jgi:polyisoprenoid-binding protein YceI
MQVHRDTTDIVKIPIDIDESNVNWRGTEMWGSSSHEGTINLNEGYLEISEGLLSGGYFQIDMHSITVTDIPKSDPIPRRNLTEHLKSEDFFLVEKYPTAEFNITDTRSIEENSIKVTGDLTIRDVSRPISFTALQDQEDDSVLTFQAIISINRFDWNISYQGGYLERLSSILDNNLVDEEIVISVQIVTKN